mmetsp:Transcript_4733/g.5421  ORF Transcript_4733/g.5421 Transcript_4733/m.5421 type:complete len:213 (+) Transcript_4733:118-756(+)
MAVVDFINFHYRQARHNKNKSGAHSLFENFIGGRAWLLFYYDRLEEIGDKDLSAHVCPQLDESVFNVSSSKEPLPTPQKKARKMKQASRSPSPTTNDSGITNQQLLTAKYAAASAFNTSLKISDDIMKRKRINELELLCIDYNKKRCAIGDTIKQMKQQRNDAYNTDVTKRLKEEKHQLKKILRYNENESKKLKEELKLDEIDVSDSSSDSD